MPGEADGPVDVCPPGKVAVEKYDQFTYGLRMPKARRGFQPSARPFAVEVEGRFVW
jgi:hypothetical protein